MTAIGASVSGNTPIFVGRTTEMDWLRTTLLAACAGQGSIVLLAGEPGIGKTRIAEEIGRQATEAHAQVLWGRCYEGTSTPAFWPWVQILRAYLRTQNATGLLPDLQSDIANLSRLVPELGGAHLPQPVSSLLPDDEQERFYLFNSVTTLLLRAAQIQPTVLILDDLQWADIPSLVLLQFLANELHQAALLVIGAYRSGEVGSDHPLLKTVAGLSRLRRSRLITLAGLDPADVAHFMQAFMGRAPVATLLTTIMNQTGGNPFFMTEVAHQLLRREMQAANDLHTELLPTALPTVRGAIRQRLNRLSSHCNQLLNQASVIGREFSLTRLARLGSFAQELLLSGLDEAVHAKLIQPLSSIAGVGGRYRFIHDLVRETLYVELPTAERLRLHQHVGEMLEQVHAADPGVHLAELSYHFCRAAPLGSLDKAIDYTVRAAERSLQALAYEEASRYYAQALDLLATQENAETAHRTDLLLALGRAQMRSGESAQARATFEQAAAAARQTGDISALAHAALGLAGGVVQPGVADDRIIALLTEAFAALGEAENALGARLLARLAMEYRYSPARERGKELSHLAVGIARRLKTIGTNRDEERAALVLALNARHFAILAPDTLEERMAISLELAQLAQARGDRELMLQSLPWRVADMLALGHIQAADEAIDQAGQMASTLRQPLYLWYVSVFRSLRAHMHGRLAEGESLAETAHGLGQRVQPDAADVYWGAQRFMIRWEQGRLAEMEAPITDLAARFPAMPVLRCMRALVLWHNGRADEAAAELAKICANRAAALPWDQLWLGSVATLAELAILLSDHAHAAFLYDLLLPYGERNVMMGVPNCLGAAATYLGGLAALTGRPREARQHFENGLAINERLGIRPFLVRTQLRFAMLLLHNDPQTNRLQALGLLRQAQATAHELGMAYHLAQISSSLAQIPSTPAPSRSSGANPAGLTQREIEVLRLIAAGHSTKAMATALSISVPTVERHITHIYEKLGISSRAEATAVALRQGLA